MTVIVGCIEEGTVHMGADSAGVGGYALEVRRDPKLFRVGEMLIGFTSSFRMGQLLRFKLTPPPFPEDAAPYDYMVIHFVDAVRECLKEGGMASKTLEAEAAGEFLVGLRGHLFCVESDYQVGECLLPFTAIGCGSDIAKGALSAFHALPDGQRPPLTERLRIALEASEQWSAGVRRPFLYDSI